MSRYQTEEDEIRFERFADSGQKSLPELHEPNLDPEDYEIDGDRDEFFQPYNDNENYEGWYW
jgi:hypothetical protein